MIETNRNRHRRRFVDAGGLLLWSAAGSAVAVIYWHYGLLSRFSDHWPLVTLIVLVGLMIAGQFGGGFGVPRLFRDDPDRPPWHIGRSLLSGFGAALLVYQVCAVVFYMEWINHFDRVVLATDAVRAWDAAVRRDGLLGGIVGEHRIGPPVDEANGLGLVFGASLPLYVRYMGLAAGPILALLGLCVVLPTPELDQFRGSGSRPSLNRTSEVVGYLIGFAMATAAALLLAFLVAVLTEQLAPRGLPPRAFRFAELVRLYRSAEVPGQPATAEMADAAQRQAAFITGAVPSLLIVVVLTFAATLVLTPASPGLAFGLVFSLLAMAYLLVSALADEARVLVVGAVLLTVVLLNSNPYKYRFPGLAWYLDHDRKPDERGRLRRISRKKNLHRADQIVERGQIPLGPPGLLRDADVLEAWRARLDGRDGREKPKLVLMTTSGGAYRAAFWTTLVLEALEEQVPGFLEHIRLMTGASGGMVGAAYVAAMMEAADGPAGRAVLPESPTARLSAETGDDSLTAVVRELIRRDLPKAVLWSQARDRGVVLEEQWPTLDRSFASLRDGEAAGWRPSLVLAPMVVETGRRLLFSNLDLYGLTEAQSRDRSTVSIEEADFGVRPDFGEDRRYSRSAVEFFRAFPEVYEPEPEGDGPRDAFKLRTAVRMNATFPFLSPAVNLPVKPARRLVDAGYYDNYGVNVALSWLHYNRRWVKANTSGVALLQIRAFPSEIERKRLWVGTLRDEPRGATARLFDALGMGVEAVTTPLFGGVSALTWAMSYRNDEQIRELDDYFNGHAAVVRPPGTPRFFETVIFENPVPFGMNWFISRDEIDRMRESLGYEADRPRRARAATLGDATVRASNVRQLEALRSWW